MTKGMDISFYKTLKLSFCESCFKGKMTCLPHRKPRVRTTRPGYRIHADVRGGGDTYISWRGYKYFFLAVCEATYFTFVKFMKKKSEALLVFMDLVTLLDRQHDMKVCILHTDFGELNSTAAEPYFARKKIKWEASASYAQQQNGLAEQHIRTTIEGARTIMVDSSLPLHLWTEAISTMVYLKNKSPFSAIQDGKVTPEEAFTQHCKPRVDHLRIFGSMAFVFEEDPGSKLQSKAWKGYLVGYEERNQYHIYDLTRHQVFVRRDVTFYEDVIGPNGKPSQSEQLICPNEGDEYVNFPVLNCMTVDLQVQSSFSQPLPVGPVSETPAIDLDSNSLTELGITNDNTSDPDITSSSIPQASIRRTTRNIERIDYRKAYTGKAPLSKTNSSVPITSLHSGASQVIRDYVLSLESPIRHTSTPIKGFVCIARKKTKASMPDMPLLKDAMASSEKDEWKIAMEIEYEALLANGTWELVDRPTHQHVLTGKWAFKRNRDINRQVKRYKARWVGRAFEQREGVDYFETFAAVVKASTNKALFAITANKQLHSHQLDAVTAFLNSNLDTEVYIKQPEMFHNGNYGQVLRLRRSFYGLKQSTQLWFDLFAEEMRALGFYQSQYDTALFLDGKGIYVAIYVDDLQIIGPSLKVIEELKTRLAQRFKMTDLRPNSHYLGMEVQMSKGAVTII